MFAPVTKNHSEKINHPTKGSFDILVLKKMEKQENPNCSSSGVLRD